MASALDGLEFRSLHEFQARRCVPNPLLNAGKQRRRAQHARVLLQFCQKRSGEYRIALTAIIQYRLIASRGNQQPRALGQLELDVIATHLRGPIEKNKTRVSRQQTGITGISHHQHASRGHAGNVCGNLLVRHPVSILGRAFGVYRQPIATLALICLEARTVPGVINEQIVVGLKHPIQIIECPQHCHVGAVLDHLHGKSVFFLQHFGNVFGIAAWSLQVLHV